MIKIEKKEVLNIGENIYKRFKLNEILFFDIETTGFDKEKSNLILISIGYFINQNIFTVKQYFGERLEDERDILLEFKKEARNFKKWCTYNGIAFDEPFIRKKMKINSIEFNNESIHLDLYRMIRPYHKQLGMERCNLKSVERYIGIKRKDEIDGGISIELYYEYLKSKNEDLKNIIMLHNYEDVLNLPKIFEIVYSIENNSKLRREDGITIKQFKYLSYLMKKNKINIKINMKKISKRSAGRIINNINNGDIDIKKFKEIIKNSY